MDPVRKKGRSSPFSDVTNVPSKGMGYRAYSLFTCDTPVVFNFIGYLILLQRLFVCDENYLLKSKVVVTTKGGEVDALLESQYESAELSPTPEGRLLLQEIQFCYGVYLFVMITTYLL